MFKTSIYINYFYKVSALIFLYLNGGFLFLPGTSFGFTYSQLTELVFPPRPDIPVILSSART